eukprot:g3756.t1
MEAPPRVTTTKKTKKRRSPQGNGRAGPSRSSGGARKKSKHAASGSASPRWLPVHTTFKAHLEAALRESLRAALKCSPSAPAPPNFDSDVAWLLSTREAFSFCLKLDRSDGAMKAICEKLFSFLQEAKQRRSDLEKGVRVRMVELEREAFSDKKLRWEATEITVRVPPGSFLSPNMGMKFGRPMVPSTPDGLYVSGFAPDMMGQPGPIERAGSVCVGDVITKFTPGNGSGKAAVQAAINMFVNMSVLRLMNAGGMMMAMPGMMAMPPAAESVTLVVHRLDAASQAKVDAMRARALAPGRMSMALESPLVDSYARATHATRGEDALWLLNKASVINTILAPLERKEELRVLFKKKRVRLGGECGDQNEDAVEDDSNTVLNPAWTANRPKMYDLFSVPELVNKFIRDGEVGRGRNKTSLKTASQVVNVVMAELKKAGLVSK